MGQVVARFSVGGWMVGVALVGVLVLGGCQSQPSFEVPAEFSKLPADVPRVVSFSAGEGEIRVETALMMVPVEVLEGAAVLKGLTEAPGAELGPVAGKGVDGQVKAIQLDKDGYTTFLRTIQRNQQMLANPKFGLISGQPASFAATQSINYVKSVDAKIAKEGTTDPRAAGLKIEQLTTGIWLELTASVTADRKTLETRVHPTFITLDGMDTFFADDKPGGAFVQLPKVTTTTFSTSAAIADGGTLVIVGPVRVGEKEAVSGGFGGMFTNRSYVKSECRLVVVVRPVIGRAEGAAKVEGAGRGNVN